MRNVLENRFLIIGITVLLLLISFWKIPTMRANYAFEDFFPEGDASVTFFRQIEKEFGTASDLVLVAFEQTPSVFDAAFMKQINSFSEVMMQDSTVKRITGIHNFMDVHKTPFGFIQKKTLPSNPDTPKFKSRILKDPRMLNVLINEKGTAVCLLVEPTKDINAKAANLLIDAIVANSKAVGLSRPKIGGQLYTETTYVKLLERENIRLIPIFMVVVSIVLLLLYRSIVASLVPTISVVIGLILLYGYAAWVGRDINMSTLMYPTIMAVVGMSDLIHLYTKYQDQLIKGVEKKAALLNSLSELRSTLFLTSLTTIIGFLSISLSDMPHVHTFGLDAAFGVVIAYIVAILLTPIILFYIPTSMISLKKQKWDSLLNKAYNLSRDYPKYIVGISILLLVLGIVGIKKVNTNNKLLDSISEKSVLKKEFLFFETEFSGIRALELVVSAKEGFKINDPKNLKDIDKLVAHIHTFPAIGAVFSPCTFYKTIYDAQKGPALSQYQLPDKESSFRSIEKLSKKFQNPFVNDKLDKGIITARMTDVGRLEVQKILNDINGWADQHLPNRQFEIRPTGKHALIDRTNELMIDSMFEGLLLALTLISLIIGFLFRSFKWAMISLVPNIFPLILTGGLMGYLGIELNGSSAIIFTISFVIAVDDTIHFLKKYAFVQEHNRHETKEKWIHQTILEAGKAILITSIILISGYGVLILSDFKEAYYHGVLICVTMIWAVLADLFLLPILLRKFG